VVVSAPESADDYPTVRWIWRERGWEAGGLRVGDQLLRLGETDLRGVGPFGFVARVYKDMDTALRVPVAFVRAGQRREAVLGLPPAFFSWQPVPLTLLFVVLGVLLLLRAPGSRLPRAIFLAHMAYSFRWLSFYGGPHALTYAWAGVYFISWLVAWPLILRMVLIFPEQGVPTSARMPTWPWLFAVAGPMATSGIFGVPFPPESVARAGLVMVITFALTLLVLVTRRFLRVDPIGRRQVKWVVYGLYLSIVPVLAARVVVSLDPSWWWLLEFAVVLLAFIPLCIFIAIVRFNLLDIDRLISATAAYSILMILLLAGVLIVIPQLSQAVSTTVGVDLAVGQTVISLLLAAVVVPGQRYLRPRIERLFFAERYALECGVEHLLRELSACEGPQAVLTLAGERLDTLLRPECCVIYGRAGAAYVPVFVRGSAVPPAFDASGALVGALQTRAAPVDTEQWQRRTAGVRLGPADRAALDSLGAAVLLPVGGHEPLPAFVCLGQKRSGDVYTSTDLALLAAVADKVSGELRLFDEEEIRRQAQAMRDALRRYVPGSVAARVLSGQELEAREQEVSVLFVDIRGYTTYSEGRTAAEIFSTVNHYTETVSRVMRQNGGTVVEFNGDGMMAVFGAPDALVEKERAAVQAGREIVTAVRALALGETRPESRPLEVGIGIATGPAFVGNIQAVDRLIWTAIGNTTNLAARLQSLTRELDAAIVIDARTWRVAGEAAATFELHAHTPIRGRHQTEDVYVLPLTASTVLAQSLLVAGV
jgi:class 3 adenylate cyclase